MSSMCCAPCLLWCAQVGQCLPWTAGRVQPLLVVRMGPCAASIHTSCASLRWRCMASQLPPGRAAAPQGGLPPGRAAASGHCASISTHHCAPLFPQHALWPLQVFPSLQVFPEFHALQMHCVAADAPPGGPRTGTPIFTWSHVARACQSPETTIPTGWQP